MTLGKWIIPREYNRPAVYPKGGWEGDCVFVLAWDKDNKRLFIAKGHAYSYTQKIRYHGVGIITAANGYYNIITEMVPVPKKYERPTVTEQEMQIDLIQYLFRIVSWSMFK